MNETNPAMSFDENTRTRKQGVIPKKQLRISADFVQAGLWQNRTVLPGIELCRLTSETLERPSFFRRFIFYIDPNQVIRANVFPHISAGKKPPSIVNEEFR